MLFCAALAAAEQARHLEVLAAQGAIGRSLHERRVESQDRFEFLLDSAFDTSRPARTPNYSARAPMFAASQK